MKLGEIAVLMSTKISWSVIIVGLKIYYNQYIFVENEFNNKFGHLVPQAAHDKCKINWNLPENYIFVIVFL